MLWAFSLSELAADALLCDKQVDCKIRRTRTKRFCARGLCCGADINFTRAAFEFSSEFPR